MVNQVSRREFCDTENDLSYLGGLGARKGPSNRKLEITNPNLREALKKTKKVQVRGYKISAVQQSNFTTQFTVIKRRSDRISNSKKVWGFDMIGYI
jgi:hypothetical protein